MRVVKMSLKWILPTLLATESGTTFKILHVDAALILKPDLLAFTKHY